MSPSPSSGLPSPTFPPPRLPPRSPARPAYHQLSSPLAQLPAALSASKQPRSYTPTASAVSSRHPSLQVSLRIASSNLNSSISSPLNNHTSYNDYNNTTLVEDILAEGDIIGEGITLQGETITLVDMPSSPRDPSLAPASELEVVRKLGTGSYAVVFLVREVIRALPTLASQDDLPLGTFELTDEHRHVSKPPFVRYGREFAVKCLSKANLSAEALEVQMFEARIHQSLPIHSNVVTLHRTLQTPSFLLLILESVPGQDLFFFLEQSKDHEPVSLPSGLVSASVDHSDPDSPNHNATSTTPPTPSLLSTLHPSQILSHSRLRLIASMFAQMCEAVASCHEQGVSHRDIKPENFIVTDGLVPSSNSHQKMERRVIVKLSDFGLATRDEESCDMDCGSAPYMSYECRNNCAPSYATQPADVWSLGIVLINMLYHLNPWVDTCIGACPAFDSYRKEPVDFFMRRFTGMTHDVAEFLTTRVFCILDDEHCSKPVPQRISACELGIWARNLPAMFDESKDRLNSASRSPSARSSLAAVSRPTQTPITRERLDSLSEANDTTRRSSNSSFNRPQLRPISTSINYVNDLGSTNENDAENDKSEPSMDGDADSDHKSTQAVGADARSTDPEGVTSPTSGLCSRGTSTDPTRRRKRGKKGKASQHQNGNGNPMSPGTPSAITPASEYGGFGSGVGLVGLGISSPSSVIDRDQNNLDAHLDKFAEAAQVLAREVSKKSKTPKSGEFPPFPSTPPPSTPLLSTSLSSRPMGYAAFGMPAGPPPPVPPLPAIVSTPLPPIPTNANSVPRSAIVKKPSKWNVFGRKDGNVANANEPTPTLGASVSSLSLSSTLSTNAPSRGAPSIHSNGSTDRSSSTQRGMSATAASVTNILMSLDPPPRSTNSSRERSKPNARVNKADVEFDRRQISTQSSGHSSLASLSNQSVNSLTWNSRGRGRDPHDLNWGPSSPPESSFHHNHNHTNEPRGTRRDPHRNPLGPPWTDRSPSSLRSRAANSSNWRQSTQTTSSASSIAPSGITRFSNASVRSVSTVATSVSGNGSILRYSMSKSSFVSSEDDTPQNPMGTAAVNVPMRSPNQMSPMVKRMDGVPWELDGYAPRYPGSPPQNPRMPNRKSIVPAPLDTISERPRLPIPLSPPANHDMPSKVYRSQDAATSTTDLDSESITAAHATPKKVHKGQINTLKMMLSSFKTSRGKEQQ